MSDWKPVDHEVRAAVEHDGNRNFMIEAGAGTGKTELMVQRVVAMIRTGVATIDQIVVITFTDAAAVEISARTREALEVLTSGDRAELKDARLEPMAPEEAPLVSTALEGIHRAHIQTIHAFASSMLRERPVEAGIDPAFAQLDEMQESAGFDRAFDKWFDRTLEQVPPELAAAMDRGLGPRQIRTIAEVLQRHRSVLRLKLPKVARPDIEPFVNTVRDAAAELRGLLIYSGDDARGREDIEFIIKFGDQVGLSWEAHDEDGVLRVLLTQAPDIKHGAGKKSAWTDKESADRATELRQEVRENLKQLHEKLGTAILLSILPIIEQFVRGYARERKKDGEAIFDDLLIWARKLLKNDVARNYFRRRFTRIVVDEFQDTDPVQADIVFCLAGTGAPPTDTSWTSMVPRDGVLTIVGDPKQSIYRFRRADLAVFDSIRNGVMQPHQTKITQNFRSREGVLNWVNTVFDAQFVEEPGVQPANTTLVHAPRMEEFDQPAVHVAWAGPNEKVAPARVDEAKLLARCLIHAHQTAWSVFDKSTSSVRAVRWEDMAVLVPAWTDFDTYALALRAMGVPFRVGGGKGFFARREVAELGHLLEAIHDPLDDIAVAATLRSPMFGCSDDELMLAVGTGRGINYRQYPTKGCPPRVADGLRAIREMHDVLPRLTLTQAVKMAADQSLLVEQALARPGEEQEAANLMKVVDMSRRYARLDATLGLRNFSRWLRGQREIEEDAFRSALREGDAGIADAGDDVVRVMTIHASKGLEFPLVALANMSGQRNLNSSPIPDRGANQIHFQVKGFGGTYFATPNYDDRWQPEKEAQAAEITRLVYVGTTRARDHLVIPLALEPSKMGPYMKQLMPHLPGPPSLLPKEAN